MAGVTTMQSPGQPGDVDLRDAIARGVFPGPRILTSMWQITPTIGTPADLRQTVRELKRLRADVVKIFSVRRNGGGEQAMTREQFEALCGEASAQGLRTMVHAQTIDGSLLAVQAGCIRLNTAPAPMLRAAVDGRARRIFRSECRRRHAELPAQQARFLGVADIRKRVSRGWSTR